MHARHSKFSEKTNTSFLIDLTEEVDKPSDEKLKYLNIKLKQATDAWRFVVVSDDVERVKSKKRKANDLEEEIDDLLDEM